MKLTHDEIMGLIKNPKNTIPEILNRRNIDYDYKSELPFQLTIFDEYFDES